MRRIKVVKLEHTVPVSVTGTVCQLKCKHCNAHYLKHMLPLSNLKVPPSTKSILVSGGSDLQGKVPVFKHMEEIKKLKNEGYRLNFHVGLVSEKEARVLGELADAISFDFVGNDETIRYVYNLDKSVSDYVKTFEYLRKYTENVYPHVTVGLSCGKIGHEYTAVDLLSHYDVKKVVFIVFIPTVGTYFSECPVPKAEEVRKVFSYAHRKLENVELILGCMYPRGKHRNDIAMTAIESGFDTITQPSKEIVDFLKRSGYELTFSDECCVL